MKEQFGKFVKADAIPTAGELVWTADLYKSYTGTIDGVKVATVSKKDSKKGSWEVTIEGYEFDMQGSPAASVLMESSYIGKLYVKHAIKALRHAAKAQALVEHATPVPTADQPAQATDAVSATAVVNE